MMMMTTTVVAGLVVMAMMQKLIISMDNASGHNCDGEPNENNNLPETRWLMEQTQSCV